MEVLSQNHVQLSPRNFDHRSQGTFHLFQQMLSSPLQLFERQLSPSRALRVDGFSVLPVSAVEALSVVPKVTFLLP